MRKALELMLKNPDVDPHTLSKEDLIYYDLICKYSHLKAGLKDSDILF